MLIRPIASISLLCLLLSACGDPQPAGPDPTLVIENARVIVGDGTVREQAAVAVSGDSILAVTTDPVDAPAARRIDAGGQTVLPGLIDAHVHLLMDGVRPEEQPASEEALTSMIENEMPGELRAYLESGVTSIMSTGDYAPFILNLRDRLASGEIQGPRIVAVGPVFGAPGGHPDAFVCGHHAFCKEHLSAAVDDTSEARRAVTRVAESGVDAIKLVWDDLGQELPMLSDEVVQAIIDETHAHDLSVYMHVTDAGPTARALEWGVDRLVHVPAAGEGTIDAFTAAMSTHDATAATTLVAFDEVVRMNGRPPGMVQFQKTLHATVDTLAAIAPTFVVLGTDAPWLSPAESVHQELGLLEDAGLTPHQILQTATRNAAVHIGRGDDLGTAESGKLADLVIVDGNPLDDLATLQSVAVVVKDGQVVVNKQRE